VRKLLTFTAAALLGTAIAGCQSAAITPPAATPGPTITTTQVGDKLLGVAAAGGYVYCGCANFVDLFDTATGQRGKRLDGEITVGPVRTFIDRREVLVQDEAKGELRVLDAAATAPTLATVGGFLQALPVGKGAGRLALGDDNQTVASSAGNDTKVVSFFFQSDNRAQAPARTEWEVGAPSADGQARPIDWKNSKLLTVDFASKGLKLFDKDNLKGKQLATLQAVGPVGIGTDVGKATIVKGASEGVATVAMAIDKGQDALVLVDLATNEVKTLTGLGKGLRQLLVDPDNGRAFVGAYDSDEVAVVDYRTKSLLTKLAVAHHPMTIALAPPVEGEIWVGG
jgi:DNA-binding beta-propeller fold protein YncE